MNTKRSDQWLLFISVILLLFGIYGLARTCINLVAFEKYPQEGVYPPLPFLNNPGYAPYYNREEDCHANYVYTKPIYPPYPSYPVPYGGEGGGYGYPTIEALSPEEQKNAEDEQRALLELQKQNCLASVADARDKAKVNDLSQSVLFLFLGAGVLLARRIFTREK